jgi:predicted flap endonuclease-1-like 5' DNA nuclease
MPTIKPDDRGALMLFTTTERASLLKVKGVGPTVIKRLEDMGISSLDQLSKASTTDIVAQAAAMLGASCWKNSPQARAAIDAAIACAKQKASERP